MAGIRLYCAVVIAVSMIAASTAKPSDGAGEQRDSLKELLLAMKRYLTDNEQRKSSSRADAYDDVKTVYDACKICIRAEYFSRPYWVVRSRLWYDVLSVCRLSVCNVLYCG